MSHNSRVKPAIKRNIFICITKPFLFFESKSNQEYVEHNTVDDMHLIITTCNLQVTVCFVNNSIGLTNLGNNFIKEKIIFGKNEKPF